jgi:purine-binding chemotaxis protein CheW
MTSDERQYCAFYVAGHYFGIDVTRVQEVIRYHEMTRVPLSPPAVRGLINLRGRIVTAIDLRRQLDLGERPEGDLPVNVVVLTAEGAVSLLVDEIDDVVTVPNSAFESPPATLQGSARDFILGACKLRDRLLLVVDPERATSVVSNSQTPRSNDDRNASKETP